MSRIDYPLIRPTLSGLRQILPSDVRDMLDAASGAATELGVELWAVGGAIRDLVADLAVGGWLAQGSTPPATAARSAMIAR